MRQQKLEGGGRLYMKCKICKNNLETLSECVETSLIDDVLALGHWGLNKEDELDVCRCLTCRSTVYLNKANGKQFNVADLEPFDAECLNCSSSQMFIEEITAEELKERDLEEYNAFGIDQLDKENNFTFSVYYCETCKNYDYVIRNKNN